MQKLAEKQTVVQTIKRIHVERILIGNHLKTAANTEVIVIVEINNKTLLNIKGAVI